MKCDEFRREFDLRLDPAEPEKLTPEMREHLAGCAPCTRYANAMGAVDRALRMRTVQPLPLEMKLKLYAIPLKAMQEDMNPKLFIRRGIFGLVAALAIAFLGVLLPPDYQFWPRVTICTAGYIMVIVTAIARKGIAISYE